MRKIKVMSPNKNVTFETQANNWGQLSEEISNTHGISLDNMIAICGNNKLTFDLPQAKLPVFDGPNDLVIMIVQGKSNKGSDYSEAKSFIQRERERNPEKAKSFFGNYTQLSKDKMLNLVKLYKAKKNAKKALKNAIKENRNNIEFNNYDQIDSEVYAEVSKSVKKR